MEDSSLQVSKIRKIFSVVLFLVASFFFLVSVYYLLTVIKSFVESGDWGGAPGVVAIDDGAVLGGLIFLVGAILLQLRAFLRRQQYTFVCSIFSTVLYLVSILFFTGVAKLLGFDF